MGQAQPPSPSMQAQGISEEALRSLLYGVAESVAEALLNPEKIGDAAAKVVAFAQLLEAAVQAGLDVNLKTNHFFAGDSMLYAYAFVWSNGKPYIGFEVYCDVDIPTLYSLVDRETLRPEDLESYADYLGEVAEFMREAAKLLRSIPGLEATTTVHRSMECRSQGHSIEFEYWFEVEASPPPSVDDVKKVLEKAVDELDMIHEVCGMAP